MQAYPAGDQLHQGLYGVSKCISHEVKADTLTERHLDLLSNPFDAHKCE